jgi:ferric iron reductase protein FhuF
LKVASSLDLSGFLSLVAFWHIHYIRKQTNRITAMTTSFFSQKNVCAALGFAMALTIVLKAKAESSHSQHTARFETTKPTPQIGFQSEQGPELLQVSIYKSEKS